MRPHSLLVRIVGISLALCLTSFSSPLVSKAVAAIEFVGADDDAASSGDASLLANVPATIAEGDFMVAAISVRPSSMSITAPSGWTLIQRMDNGTGNTNSLAVYVRRAISLEPASYTFVLNAAHAGGVIALQAYRGVHPTSAIDASAGAATASSLVHAAPSVTTTGPDRVLLTFHSFSSSATWSPPAEMTEILDIASLSPDNTNGVSLEVNELGLPVAGSTGARSATASANADVGNAFSLAMAPTDVIPVELSRFSIE